VTRRNIFIRNVDGETWDEFRIVVAQKEQKLHGVLGEAVTEALKLYIDKLKDKVKENRGSEPASTPPSRKALKELPELKRAILEKVEPGGSIPKQMLEGIIRQVSHVMDRRAVNDRIGALLADGFLQRKWELSTDGNVFRVVGGEADNIG
jgi:hypothetical protein